MNSGFNKLCNYITLGVFGVFLVSCAPPDWMVTHKATYSLEPYCSPKKQTIKEWSVKSSSIFIGRAEEVDTKFEKFDFYANNCWVKFSVQEVLKGKKASNIIVEALYNTYKDGWKKIPDAANCHIKSGQSYLIFGYEEHLQSYPELENYVITAINDNPKDAGDCPPVIPITELQQSIDDIRKTIKTGNEK